MKKEGGLEGCKRKKTTGSPGHGRKRGVWKMGSKNEGTFD